MIGQLLLATVLQQEKVYSVKLNQQKIHIKIFIYNDHGSIFSFIGDEYAKKKKSNFCCKR